VNVFIGPKVLATTGDHIDWVGSITSMGFPISVL